MGWTANDMPDQSGRTIVVTGGNSGLGFEAAAAFAARNAHVVLACRNEDKAARAAAQMQGEPTVMKLDLADLASVRSFADAFEGDRIDVLCNNAGVMGLPYAKTADGFEMQLGTNHFGHFALTGLLLPKLLETPRSRVVNVSSLMYKAGRMNFSDLDAEDAYDKWRAYGQSKLANLLFTYELQRRLDSAGVDVASIAAHPGYADTNLQQGKTGSWIEESGLRFFTKAFAQSAQMGALPTMYAAVHEDVRGGDFIGPSGFMQLRGNPRKVESDRRTHDPSLAGRLWDVSVARTGVDYSALADP